jgi:FkbM family methyltransferase
MKYRKKLPWIRVVKWFFYKYVTNKKVHQFDVLGNSMLLDLRVQGISRALAIYGERELDMVGIVRSFIKPGMKIFDLGANIGYYTLELTRLVGPQGRVLAIEPDPRNIKVLSKNIDKYTYPGVVTMKNCAVGEFDGKAQIGIEKKSNLNSMVFDNNCKQSDMKEVDVYTIEALSKKYLGGEIDLIRMDIEGFEVEALRGSLDFLGNLKKGSSILFETHPNKYTIDRDISEVLRVLEGSGYVTSSIVCTDNGRIILDTKNHTPLETIKSDGFVRYLYKNIPMSEVIDLVPTMPKSVRYVHLVKK